jgi:hypothetical protein
MALGSKTAPWVTRPAPQPTTADWLAQGTSDWLAGYAARSGTWFEVDPDRGTAGAVF